MLYILNIWSSYTCDNFIRFNEQLFTQQGTHLSPCADFVQEISAGSPQVCVCLNVPKVYRLCLPSLNTLLLQCRSIEALCGVTVYETWPLCHFKSLRNRCPGSCVMSQTFTTSSSSSSSFIYYSRDPPEWI